MLQNGVTGTPSEVADRIERLAAAGADTLYLHLYAVDDLDHIRLLGSEVLPRVREAAPGAVAG
jgi:alkanesulfonate monooxygenase SsuD/methylene tetrahydromethanopterin reductase-like flavin-dependent oxidoreductase (luciferase family)